MVLYLFLPVGSPILRSYLILSLTSPKYLSLLALSFIMSFIPCWLTNFPSFSFAVIDLVTKQFSLGSERPIFCFQYVVSLLKLSFTSIWTPIAAVFKLLHSKRLFGYHQFQGNTFSDLLLLYGLSPKTSVLSSHLPFNNSPSPLYKQEKPNFSKILQSFISLGIKFQCSQLLG